MAALSLEIVQISMNDSSISKSYNPTFEKFLDLHQYYSSLAGVPPIGVKWSAGCYEDSPTAGNAQCVADCVEVTALNGSSFYPMVRSFSNLNPHL